MASTNEKTKEATYKLNPSFKRLIITAKNNNRAVSDMIGIEDLYTKFCIDETADYVFQKLLKEIQDEKNPTESGNSLLNKHAKRK